MEVYKNKIKEQTTGFDLNTLEESKDIIYALSKGLKLIYYNPAWRIFAKENGADDEEFKEKYLDQHIVNSIPAPFKNYFVSKFNEVLKTGKVWHFDYECSSAETYRLFNQIAYPFKNRRGIIVVNRLRVELPMTKTIRHSKKALEKFYLQETGFINQCCNCRCIESVGNKNEWDWVPEWVKQMHPKTSHTICPVCYDYYWKYHKVKFALIAN